MELTINDINIERFDGESNKLYNDRVVFIKKVNNNTKDLKESIRLSKIWVNFKYNNCKYSPEVYNLIKKYL